MDAAYSLFETAIGRCGIAWRGDAVVAFALPGEDDAATAAALTRRCPGCLPDQPSPAIGAAVVAVRRLLAGERADLRFIRVDLSAVSPFERSVLERLREVEPGQTVTYGELAERVGNLGAARAVGVAMARNPVPVIIPCHRVLAGGGRSGGFSAPGGVSAKFRLLEIERAGCGGGLLFGDLPLAIRK
jgi:methylated-DNA-[protein]-cysteine S-methyltransferase